MLEEDGTSIAPPQRLRSQKAASPPQPLPGTRERVENRVADDDESDESEDEVNNDNSNNENGSEGSKNENE